MLSRLLLALTLPFALLACSSAADPIETLADRAPADAASHDATTSPDDAATASQDAAPPPVDGGAPTWTNVHAFLQTTCSGAAKCHAGPNPLGVLEIGDSDATYAALVNVSATSTGCAGSKRVVPGNAKASVLFQAIDSTSACSGAMPPKYGGLLPSWQRALVHDWIESGAPKN